MPEREREKEREREREKRRKGRERRERERERERGVMEREHTTHAESLHLSDIAEIPCSFHDH